MIDQIKNKTVNTGISNTKDTNEKLNQASSTVSKVNDSTKTKTDAFDGKVSQFITKEKI